MLNCLRTGGIDDVEQAVGKDADLVGQRVRPRHYDQPEILRCTPARQCRDQGAQRDLCALAGWRGHQDVAHGVPVDRHVLSIEKDERWHQARRRPDAGDACVHPFEQLAVDRPARVPRHAHEHIAVLANQAVDVDLLAEGTFRRRAHVVTQVGPGSHRGREHQCRGRTPVARSGHRHARGGLATLLELKLFVEYGRIRLAQEAGDCRRGIAAARQATREVLDRVGVGETVLDVDVTLRLVGHRRGPASANDESVGGQRRGSKAGCSERSGFGGHRATSVRSNRLDGRLDRRHWSRGWGLRRG